MQREQRAILVVEDDAPLREAILHALEVRGYHAVGVGSGEEALERLHDSGLVLLDGNLPGRDGWEVCREIKDRFPAGLPVVMVTAQSGQEDRDRARSSGADGFVAKPFGVVELLILVESMLSQTANGCRASGQVAGPQPLP